MGMNAGFAAYLAGKKANKSLAPMPAMTGPIVTGGKVQAKHIPKGKRHSKISIKMKGK